MTGWFDAFRENGGPTWYGDNRTQATVDPLSVTIITVFLIFFTAFLCIFPGIRQKKAQSFFSVTTSLCVGAVILQKLDAVVGVNFGLSFVNITLKGAPEGRGHEHLSYNERFEFAEVYSMQRELDVALSKGLPYPILSIIEYLSVDRAGFTWGRSYRLAGYYTCILLWLAFAVWILSLMMLCLIPQYFARTLIALGTILWLSNLVFALAAPYNLMIPFAATGNSVTMLKCYYCWAFWLVLVTGALCVSFGSVVRLLELCWLGYKFSTFLQFDYDDEEHSLSVASARGGVGGNYSNNLRPGPKSQHNPKSDHLNLSGAIRCSLNSPHNLKPQQSCTIVSGDSGARSVVQHRNFSASIVGLSLSSPDASHSKKSQSLLSTSRAASISHAKDVSLVNKSEVISSEEADNHAADSSKLYQPVFPVEQNQSTAFAKEVVADMALSARNRHRTESLISDDVENNSKRFQQSSDAAYHSRFLADDDASLENALY